MGAEASATKFVRRHNLVEEERTKEAPQPQDLSMPEQEPQEFESRDFRGLRLPMLAVIGLIVFMAGGAIYGLIFAWQASAQWSDMNHKLDKLTDSQTQMGKDFRSDIQQAVNASQLVEDGKIQALTAELEATKTKTTDRFTREQFTIWVLKTQAANASNQAVHFPDVPESPTQ